MRDESLSDDLTLATTRLLRSVFQGTCGFPVETDGQGIFHERSVRHDCHSCKTAPSVSSTAPFGINVYGYGRDGAKLSKALA